MVRRKLRMIVITEFIFRNKVAHTIGADLYPASGNFHGLNECLKVDTLMTTSLNEMSAAWANLTRQNKCLPEVLRHNW